MAEKNVCDKKYIIYNQKIMDRWDFLENNKLGLNPEKITEGSHIEAHFICPICKTRWIGEIRNVLKYKSSGCTECQKSERVNSWIQNKLKDTQKLFESNPELEKEWDYIKNGKLGLNPERLTAGSNKKAFWICPLGHSYDSYIVNRTKKNTGCSVCAGQKILPGFNDLATTRPDLLEEWDYELNNKLGVEPENVMRGSHDVVNWICPFGHKYKKEIHARTGGQGCSVCSKESQTSFPEQAIYFYLSKVFKDAVNRYGKPEIDIFIPSLNLGIEYDGEYAHRKERKDIEERKNKILKERGINLIRIKEVRNLKKDSSNVIYCKPVSSNAFLNEVILKLEERINRFYNLNIKLLPNIVKDRITIEEQYFSLRKADSIAVKYPKIAKEWDYEKNGQLKPEYITCGAHRKYWWRCSNNHSYECSPRKRINGHGCQICKGFNYIQGVNDFETKYPNLAKLWDYELNSVKPSDIKYTNDEMYWWKCEKGHSYQTKIKTMIKYNDCMGCIGNIHILIKGVNDLVTKRPDLVKDWNYEKNVLLPEQYMFTSNKIVNWKCHKCGYEWEKIIFNREKCPNCTKNNNKINVYLIDTGDFYNSYYGVKDVCINMGINYNKQRGNITSICKRNQKTLATKYILRYEKDDEFLNLEKADRLEKIKSFLNNKKEFRKRVVKKIGKKSI